MVLDGPNVTFHRDEVAGGLVNGQSRYDILFFFYSLQAAKFEPNHMPARYAIAAHRIRDAVRSQCSDDQLIWAANEMATVLKEGDTSVVDLPVAWAGLAMAHRAQHEIAAAYDGEQAILNEAEERALYTLKQVMFANYHHYEAIHFILGTGKQQQK